ncbi:hypothetical protein S7711_08256 [Stachybotrys chartarum IBT 7711]|uniref:LicD/FKTN/FKRP nucleotidyltransferase domain-containing protein n=1 Tax=Stachybotrys chartarum (strain CBS 109288 / IBT 7711) TaxID=1280523 RepID=A0A084AQK4_STACB|nr:hypothetical protein S7711_08256 [Stachybotrys chartarum IBT 7711]KFA56125.1 hypothetical protein S40293_00176 [Stachybotrys chartarum IBT 40293]
MLPWRLLSLLTAGLGGGAMTLPDPAAPDLPKRGLASNSDSHFPEPKYFHESRYRIHYDARFAKKGLDDAAQQQGIKVLIQTYLATFRELGIQTWLMHGTLLGWWWGQKACPLMHSCVMEADMYFLAAYYNMSTYYFKYDQAPKGRYFRLEVNPHFRHREPDDVLNVIDARWIDMENGLFIDITAARYDIGHKKGEGILYDKNGHQFRDTYVFPLLDTTFEGTPAKIPYKYRDMLASEYGEKALKRTEYHDYTFNDATMTWISPKDEDEKISDPSS